MVGWGWFTKGGSRFLIGQSPSSSYGPMLPAMRRPSSGSSHEARALARLTHPYIVSVFDCGRAGDLLYLVMEYVTGTSLRRLIADKAVSDRDVLDYLPQIGEALQHAHESGIVHRDVKPENILVDGRHRVRLVDFGLAKWLDPAGRRELDCGASDRHFGIHGARAARRA